MIERSYGRPTEMYSRLGIELLQREITHFKKVINYDGVCQEIDEDMKRNGVCQEIDETMKRMRLKK